ncbi:hypothetical protein SALBM217S_09656 [Streptomyces griseoloalbus]
MWTRCCSRPPVWSGSAAATRSARCCPERERLILYLRFFKGMTQSGIADQLGISQMHVSRLLSSCFAQVREELASADAC